MDPFFLHLDRWPAWAADDLAQPKPHPGQLDREDPTMEAAFASVAEALDRAADDGGSGTVGTLPQSRPCDPDWTDGMGSVRSGQRAFE